MLKGLWIHTSLYRVHAIGESSPHPHYPADFIWMNQRLGRDLGTEPRSNSANWPLAALPGGLIKRWGHNPYLHEV